MPVQVASFLIPRNNNSWYILEDKYLKGGLRVVADSTERDTLHVSSRKAGMLALTQNDNALWQLNSDLLTWSSFTVQTNSAAIFTYKQVDPLDTWVVNHTKNCMYFVQSVFDSSGKQVLPNEIEIVDNNTVRLLFGTPTAGHCVFNFDFGA
jgi:hypothetical protein